MFIMGLVLIQTVSFSRNCPPGEGGGGLGLIFAGSCAAGLSELLPNYSLFCGQ